MRGFVVGSLALIVLWALVQREAAGRVASGSNALLELFRRALDPSIAGIPQRGGTSTSAPGGQSKTPAGSGSGGSGALAPAAPF